MADRNDGKPPWRVRRRFMLAVAALCGWTIVYCVAFVSDPRQVHETAVMMSFLTLASMVGSYVFGAVWEDISKKGP